MLRKGIQRHLLPTVQIGSGPHRSTLALKLQCVCHALRLVCQDDRDLAKFLASVCTWTTDQGTESCIANVRPTPLAAFLPRTSSCNHEEEFAGSVNSGHEVDFSQPSCMPMCADLSSSLEVDDLLHCIHNATKSLGSVMQRFEGVVSAAKRLANFIRAPDSKQRLLARCFHSRGDQQVSHHACHEGLL